MIPSGPCLLYSLSKRIVGSTLLAFALFGVGTSTADAARPETQRRSILVYLKPGLASDSAERNAIRVLSAQSGGLVRYEYGSTFPDLINLRDMTDSAIDALEKLPGVLRVVDDRYHPNLINLDDSTPLIRGLQTQITSAGMSADGSGVRVCVADTGIDSDNIMYASRIDSSAGFDFHNGDPDPEDDNGHGAHVAGIAVGGTGLVINSGCGIDPFQGVAPEATLIGVKILDAFGGGFDSNIIAGIDHCADQSPTGARADVINLSIGTGQFSGSCTHPWAVAANNATANGVVVVAASGNDGFANALTTPACGADVIAVGATYDDDFPGCEDGQSTFNWGFCEDTNPRTDDLICFSNQSADLDVVAPGCRILSTGLGATNTTANKCGTSMSSPAVAGLAALLLDIDPSLTPVEVRQLIRSGAIDLGPPGFDNGYGFGRIDVIRSLLMAIPCNTDGDCDDGVACTIDACAANTCTFTPDNSVCPDDGLFCTGPEICHAALGCVSAGDPCVGRLCDEANNVCVDCLTAADCDDGVACTGVESCVAGACVADSSTPGHTVFDAWQNLTYDRASENVTSHADHLWVASGLGGVIDWNTTTATFEKYTRTDNCLPSDFDLQDITADPFTGDVWLAAFAGAAMLPAGSTSADDWVLFTSINSPLPAATTAVAVDDAGLVWIGTFDQGLFSFDGATWVQYTTENSGMTDNFVTGIVVDLDNNKWIGTFASGVNSFDGTDWTNFRPSSAPTQTTAVCGDGCLGTRLCAPEVIGLISSFVIPLTVDPFTGDVWFRNVDDGFCDLNGVTKYDGVTFSLYTSFNSGLASSFVDSAAVGPDGDTWFTSLNGTSRLTTTGTWDNESEPTLSVTVVNGEVWFGGLDGVLRHSDQGPDPFPEQLTTEQLADNSVTGVSVDQGSGDAWFANRAALQRFDGVTWQTITAGTSGLPSSTPKSVLVAGNGDVWAGFTVGGIARNTGTNWTTFDPTNSGICCNRVTSIAEDADGNIWVGSNFGGGVSEFDGSTWTPVVGAPSSVRDIARGLGNDIWVASSNGAWRFDGSAWTQFTTADGLPSDVVNAIAAHRNGDVWFGTTNGISQMNGAGFTNHTIGHPDIRDLKVDANGRVWAATWGGGISVFDGLDWTTKAFQDGLITDRVNAIDVGLDGRIWFGADLGVSIFQPPIICDNDGVCELGENCNECANDCFSVTGSASCGNGVCETGDGEDCVSCAQDCNGVQSGNPANRFCCGDGDGHTPVDCNDLRCSSGRFQCTSEPPASSCCGDLVCELTEDGVNCAVDCGGGPACTVDIDCDDGDPCTTDTCTAGACSNTPINCDDGDACTTDSCSGGDCSNIPINCDDGDACTTDSCSGGVCSNNPISCDDGDPCTTDSCDPGSGCVNTPPPCQDADGCCPAGCDSSNDDDCVLGPVCGNGVCEGSGEDCFSCAGDCRCTGRNCGNSCCGDGVCSGENANTCPIDCGG